MITKPSVSRSLLTHLYRIALNHPSRPQCHHLHNLHVQYRSLHHAKRHHILNRTPRLNPKSPHRSASSDAPSDTPPTNPANDPNWISLVDQPPTLVRARPRHRPWGLLVLAIIPLTAFSLGTWQVQRLRWKNDLVARFEDRLVRDPLPLPPTVDPDAVWEFDYRRVTARGRWRHDLEILIGPRVHDGAPGFQVVTPLDRSGEKVPGSTLLISRGWIPKDLASQDLRRKLSPDSLPTGWVKVEGLLREPFKKNIFTPGNLPEKGQWYFPDVGEMAAWTGSSRTWVEETMQMDLLTAWDREAKGVPIGRAAEVNLRNNHTQYIFTWYALSLATTIMFYMVVKKPSSSLQNRIRASRDWG